MRAASSTMHRRVPFPRPLTGAAATMSGTYIPTGRFVKLITSGRLPGGAARERARLVIERPFLF